LLLTFATLTKGSAATYLKPSMAIAFVQPPALATPTYESKIRNEKTRSNRNGAVWSGRCDWNVSFAGNPITPHQVGVLGTVLRAGNLQGSA
jgi:hypothetical protein